MQRKIDAPEADFSQHELINKELQRFWMFKDSLSADMPKTDSHHVMLIAQQLATKIN